MALSFLAVGSAAWLPVPRAAGANALPPAVLSGELPPELAPLGADPRVHALWSEGEALERAEQLLQSAQHYEEIDALLPNSAFLQWRISRNYWRYAERIPVDDKRGRLHYFGLADSWAGRSLDNDPECGECVLWKLAAMGRLATTGGTVKAMQLASTIGKMIERGIALHPTHHDEGRANVALANLYYAGAAFYRIVPDWVWVQWVIGVRGDRERALEYIRKAVAISDPRVDYQVELGAVLLCLGSERHDAHLLDEGREALRAASGIAHFQSTDEIDLGHARILLAEPERACGYSRDGWISASEVRRP
jgi:tetratricopeptide (TPR) repeat protein